MTAETKIYSLLKALCSGRVTPLSAYQAGKFPYIVYSRISTTPYVTLCGDDGNGYVRIQIDIVAVTHKEAALQAKQVRQACKTDAIFLNQYELSEPERGIFRIVQDYNIFEEGF